jgi:hypothetical protein
MNVRHNYSMTAVSVQRDDSRPPRVDGTVLACFPLLEGEAIICPENHEQLLVLLLG